MTINSDPIALDAWLTQLSTVPPWDALLVHDADERAKRGYGDTIREICQQPFTWGDSADRVLSRAREIGTFIARDGEGSLRPFVLTGSGSSEYVAHCVAPVLQSRLDVNARAVPAAWLLTHPDSCVTTGDPPVVISFARSGDSPESTAALELLLENYPRCRHLPITCNSQGRLATAYASDARVMPIVLDPRTNDRSLVMTSSFTNMAVAGLAIAALAEAADEYRRRVRLLAELARELIMRHAKNLARVAAAGFGSACFLGAGAQLGAAREAALKMLEMSAGAVSTIVETPLGLRHGPMAALRDTTLVVANLPRSPAARAYAIDVLRELHAKRLSRARVVVGTRIPDGLLADGDVAVTFKEYDELDDGLAAVLDVVVGQILALFRCLAEGLRPDAPSPDGVINRVVPQFPLYR